ncbi:MAG: hypothetical protein CL608_06980 [Anaerolineaceae bacterium]|nr:hypothetical protein [Anaerolineaceae bacterium]
MTEHTYNFGRISIYGSNIEDKYRFLLDSLNADVVITKGNYSYIIIDVEELDYRGAKYLYGVLTKFRPVQENPVVDVKKKTLSTDETEKQAVASAKFFVFIESQTLMAYRPIANKISDMQFKSSFSELIGEANNNFFVQVPVDAVNEELEIKESISILKKITKIIYNIRPSNPSSSPFWEPYDEDMKRLGIEKETRISESQKGIDPNELENDRRYMGIQMAADGYGKASIYGEKEDGSHVVISTEKMPITYTVIDHDEPVKILEQLHNKFLQISARTHHEE